MWTRIAREGLARNVLGEIRAELERRPGNANEETARFDVLAARASRDADLECLVEFMRSTPGMCIEFRRRVEALIARSCRAIESNESLRGP